ncbi:hypothetical protein V6N13_135856 [Hibiscus sabdariffa]|uniref:Uncharacterized protein n=1 Tax=Hibiscus sabdariffa TaxID=183260 RepID=A0ABR2QT00_9ROSI
MISEGLGYLASAIGKPLHSDKATIMKQLEFVKVCVEVDAQAPLFGSVLVDLRARNCVDVTVQLRVIGNDERVELESTVAQNVEDDVADTLVSNYEFASVNAEVHVETNYVVSSSDFIVVAWAIIRDIVDVDRLKGDSNVEEGGMQSDNKFDLLVDVVDGHEELDLSPKKSRLAGGGVAKLINQLKPKQQQKGAKKNGKGGKQKRKKGCTSPNYYDFLNLEC